jgi:hypothetical protein
VAILGVPRLVTAWRATEPGGRLGVPGDEQASDSEVLRLPTTRNTDADPDDLEASRIERQGKP